MAARIRLKQLPGLYAISRLGAGEAIPDWADGAGFVSISRTQDELSMRTGLSQSYISDLLNGRRGRRIGLHTADMLRSLHKRLSRRARA